MEWNEIGERILVRRHERYDLNIGLVVGEDACMVIDTRESLAAGRDLADAVRRVTSAPWTVVNTHAHFDHYFGNAAFTPCDIWALDRCAEVVERSGLEHLAEHGDADTTIVAPTRTFPPPAHVLDVGGRRVELRFLGRGHTDNDIVITVDDVLFAGDLVEEGGPPMFGDAFPAEWPDTLAALLPLVTRAVVPGHGAVVDAAFVTEQLATLREVANLSRAEAGRQVRTLTLGG